MLLQFLKNLRANPAAESSAAGLIDLHLRKQGKVSDKWEAYFPVYERLFQPLREKPIRLLEIGVQNGGSLDVWAAYFEKAELIVGCDIDPLCGELRYADPRIKVIVGDATQPATRDSVLALAQTFDIVIDDGSHRSKDIVAAFLAYFPALKDGGVFVVEDMHAVYRHVQDGGILAPTSAQEFFKLIADITNLEHWAADLSADALLARFTPKAPDWLSTIQSIEFSNSMVVIRKGPSRLGRRIVVGNEATVFPASLRHVNP